MLAHAKTCFCFALLQIQKNKRPEKRQHTSHPYQYVSYQKKKKMKDMHVSKAKLLNDYYRDPPSGLTLVNHELVFGNTDLPTKYKRKVRIPRLVHRGP